ncbi:MAG: 16S rRNA (adenine(1518)-N(6)/adenine(1519)-N(6))-dimethyltransferase RsmA [Thermodesulfobacteriota bacterium]|nr:16S rRNA (adenine(1518)-N(6)/adenine(1519)-N(6))-dimethyltransferase RsmA [Thermodesulfobacteriota bacterium]
MTSPRSLLKAWQIRPRKSMGQHFLQDSNAASMIVRHGGFDRQDVILEIGAGLGALTVPLARNAGHVLAVEPDSKIAALLGNELLAAGVSNVTIIQEDILRCDIKALTDGAAHDRPIKVVGNLPYHISSQVLIHLISGRRCIDSALLMFQKELAERLLARPGTKVYGRLSVLVQYCAEIDAIAQVAAPSFYPQPKVDSTVVRTRFLDPPPFPAADEGLFLKIVRAAFAKRRKTLKNALTRSDLGFNEGQVLGALRSTGVDPRRRAETLSVPDYVALANLLKG